MSRATRTLAAAAIVGLLLAAGSAQAAAPTDGLKKGTPDLKSAGPLAFGPEGILFIGDPAGAAIFAVATGDTTPGPKAAVKVEKIDEKIANTLGTTAGDIAVNDLKVNPASGNVYLSVARGKGPKATPVILKLDRAGKLEEFALKDKPFAKVALPNAAAKNRLEAITSMAFVKGKLIVAGLSNEEFASKLRVIPFPFNEADKGASIEIYHGSHGRFETNAPVRTFVPYDVKGQTQILAAYTCTPLVRFPVDELKPGQKVKGTTVAELGNRNRPLDMITYTKDGKDYILMANSARGVMKIPANGVESLAPITARVPDKSGIKYETIAELKGVQQLDKLDGDRALVLLKTEGGSLNLDTIPLP